MGLRLTPRIFAGIWIWSKNTEGVDRLSVHSRRFSGRLVERNEEEEEEEKIDVQGVACRAERDATFRRVKWFSWQIIDPRFYRSAGKFAEPHYSKLDNCKPK